MKVILQNLTKTFPNRNKKGEDVIAVDNFDFEIPDGSTADAEIFKCLDTIEINGKQAEAELRNGKWCFTLTAGKYTIKA